MFGEIGKPIYSCFGKVIQEEHGAYVSADACESNRLMRQMLTLCSLPRPDEDELVVDKDGTKCWVKVFDELMRVF